MFRTPFHWNDSKYEFSPNSVDIFRVAERTRMLADVGNNEVDEILAARRMGNWPFGEGGLRDLHDRFYDTSEYSYDLRRVASWAAPRSRLSDQAWDGGALRDDLVSDRALDFIPFNLPGRLLAAEERIEDLEGEGVHSGLSDDEIRSAVNPFYEDYVDAVFRFAGSSEGGFYREYARYLLAKIKASYAGEWESDGKD
jgi:hypothetical protein